MSNPAHAASIEQLRRRRQARDLLRFMALSAVAWFVVAAPQNVRQPGVLMGALVSLESVGSVVAYESMCQWIAQSESLAECKDIADKAAALKEYARRAQNYEAERRAANVRLIAERQYGSLLKELPRAPAGAARNPDGRRGKEPISDSAIQVPATAYAQALKETGVSPQSAHRYQQLASVPQAVFDRAIEDSHRVVSAAQILRDAGQEPPRPPPLRAVNGATRMDDGSLDFWGCLRDVERERLLMRDPADIFGGMTDTMQSDVRRILPQYLDWLHRLNEVLHVR